MREGWEYKKLMNLCSVKTGKKDANHAKENGKYRFYTCADNYLMCDTYSFSGKCLILPGNGVNVGKVYKYEGLLEAYQRTYVVFNINDCINFDFLYYEFLYKWNFIGVAQQYGSATNYIKIGNFENFIISYPPLSVQQSIVSELDMLSGLIAKHEEQLKAYDELEQSIFYDMFGDPVENEKGWEVKKLGECVHEMFLGPFGSALKVDSYVPKEDSYCMVYEQKHAIQGTINLDNHYISEDKYNSLQRFEVKPFDFIMSCRGTIGKLFQLPKDAPLGIIHPSLMKIRIKDDIYNYTFFQFMLIKVVANESTNGNCVQMAITAKELGKKMLPLPPLSLQTLFAEKIEAIERQKERIRQSMAEVKTLFDSRMDYYFN